MQNADQQTIQARYLYAQTVIKAAGKCAMDYYAQVDLLEVESKLNPLDVVSIADREVEKLIREHIHAQYPADGFLGEELGIEKGKNDYLWVIDPIDGTACFLNKMPTWCISIALMVGNDVVLGLIYEPNGDELFTAVQGGGAFVNGKAIQATTVNAINQGMMGIGMSHRASSESLLPFLTQLLEGEGMFIRNGSCALMMSYVAAGRLIGYFEPHINTWDCLAGVILVREAGGWSCDFLAQAQVLTEGGVILVAGKNVATVLQKMIC